MALPKSIALLNLSMPSLYYYSENFPPFLQRPQYLAVKQNMLAHLEDVYPLDGSVIASKIVTMDQMKVKIFVVSYFFLKLMRFFFMHC